MFDNYLRGRDADYALSFGLNPDYVTRFVRKGDATVEFHLTPPDGTDILRHVMAEEPTPWNTACEVTVTVNYYKPEARREKANKKS
jgi:hypothetical protein